MDSSKSSLNEIFLNKKVRISSYFAIKPIENYLNLNLKSGRNTYKMKRRGPSSAEFAYQQEQLWNQKAGIERRSEERARLLEELEETDRINRIDDIICLVFYFETHRASIYCFFNLHTGCDWCFARSHVDFLCRGVRNSFNLVFFY